MIKLVIFDLDGTLVDAFKAVTLSINHVLTEMKFPKQTHHAIKRSVGWGEGKLLAKFVGEKNQAKALKLYRQHHKQALAAKGGVAFLPGAKQLLKWLKDQGYTLAICSNRPEPYTKIILKELGVYKDFSAVLCADIVDYHKPNPDMLCQLISQFDCKLSEAVFVGDMTIDAETGKRAQMKTVCVTTGTSTEEEIRAVGAYAVISKIADLKQIILKLSSRCA